MKLLLPPNREVCSRNLNNNAKQNLPSGRFFYGKGGEIMSRTSELLRPVPDVVRQAQKRGGRVASHAQILGGMSLLTGVLVDNTPRIANTAFKRNEVVANIAQYSYPEGVGEEFVIEAVADEMGRRPEEVKADLETSRKLVKEFDAALNGTFYPNGNGK